MIAVAVAGYLILGVVLARVAWLTMFRGEDEDFPLIAFPIVLFWPVLVTLTGIVGLFYGIYQLITIAPRSERVERRRKKAEKELVALRAQAKKLGLPWPEEEGAGGQVF